MKFKTYMPEILGVPIDDELLRRLEIFARMEGCSVEEIVIRAVIDYARKRSQSL